MLNICVEETKLFITNQRAPYMICLEVYRPEEALLVLQKKTQVPTNHIEPERASLLTP